MRTILSILTCFILSANVAHADLTVSGVSPGVIVQSELVQFQVDVTNNSPSQVTLNSGSTISFTDGSHSFSSTISTEYTIEAGASADISFTAKKISPQFSSRSYQPVLKLSGSNNSSSFEQTQTLSACPVEVKPNMGSLAEIPGKNWPRQPGRFAKYYPYLVWLNNTTSNEISLDQRSRIAITDGTHIYASAKSSRDWSLQGNSVTEIEFDPGDFVDVLPGTYYPIITLIGPSFSQTITLTQNPINVVNADINNSINLNVGTYGFIGYPSTHAIPPPGDSVSYEVRGNSSLQCDEIYSMSLENKNLWPEVAFDAAATLTDIDGDGDFDLFIAGNGNNLIQYKNTGSRQSPIWQNPISCYSSIRVGPAGKPVFVDIDGDGLKDLCWGDSSGHLWAYHNIGSITKASWTTTPMPIAVVSAGSICSPAFTDIDNDGDMDIYTGSEDGTIHYYKNIGTRLVPLWETGSLVQEVSVSSFSAPAFVDIDGDGDSDFVIGDGQGNLTLYTNTGSKYAPIWGPPVSMYAGIATDGNVVPTFADIDGDGDADMFIGCGSSIKFYRNIGSAQLARWQEQPFAPSYTREALHPGSFSVSTSAPVSLARPDLYYVSPITSSVAPCAVATTYLPNMLYDVKYLDTVSHSLMAPPDGNGSGKRGLYLNFPPGVGNPLKVTFSDNCTIALTSVSCNSNTIMPGVPFTVTVGLRNPHPYALDFDKTAGGAGLRFLSQQDDCTDLFTVKLTQAPFAVAAESDATLIFEVIAGGDYVPSNFRVSPVINVKPAYDPAYDQYHLHSTSQGTTQWPTPIVLDLATAANPDRAIKSSSDVVYVKPSTDGTCSLTLTEKPAGEFLISIDRIAGNNASYVKAVDYYDSKGLVRSENNPASIRFTPGDWRYPHVIRFSLQGNTVSIPVNDLFRFSAIAWKSADVETVAQPSDPAALPDLLTFWGTTGSESTVGQGVITLRDETRREIQVGAGVMGVHKFALANIGSQQSTFKITGVSGGEGWTVKYFDAASDGNDITDLVTGSGWVSQMLQPGSDWHNCTLRAEVSVASWVPIGTMWTIRVKATPVGDDSKTDNINLTTICANDYGDVVRVSVDSSGKQGTNQGGNQSVQDPNISSDGRYVVFNSHFPDISPDDTNGLFDGFIKDTLTGELERIGVSATGQSWVTSISGDGRYVVFDSAATDLTPEPKESPLGPYNHVYLQDRQTHLITRVDAGAGNGTGGAISADGRYIVFSVVASDYSTGYIYLYNIQTKALKKLGVCSLKTIGRQHNVSISGDGRYVAFSSGSSVVVPNDTNGREDVFVYDTTTDAARIASLTSKGKQANGESAWPSISADGRYVAFISAASNLSPYTYNVGRSDYYVRDMQTGHTDWIAAGYGGITMEEPHISPDGRYVIFNNYYWEYTKDGPTYCNTSFMYDVINHTTEQVFKSRNPETAIPEKISQTSMSADGQHFVFCSDSALVNNDTNGCADAFILDLSSKKTGNFAVDLIYKKPGEQVYSGSGVYGSDQQTVAQAVNVASPAIVYFRAENKGALSDKIRISASAIGVGWTARYFDASVGGNDITDSVSGNGYVSRELITGDGAEFRAEVTVDMTARSVFTADMSVKVESVFDPTKSDTVRVITSYPVASVRLLVSPEVSAVVGAPVTLQAVACGGANLVYTFFSNSGSDLKQIGQCSGLTNTIKWIGTPAGILYTLIVEAKDPSTGIVCRDKKPYEILACNKGIQIADLKILPDKSVVQLTQPKVVTFAYDDELGKACYIEDGNRAAGIKVILLPWMRVPSVGEWMTLVGTMCTDNGGERYVHADSVIKATGTSAPSAFIVNASRLGGGAFRYQQNNGAGQQGVSGGLGLNNIGLFIRSSGRVMATGENYLYLDDGMQIHDGTYTDGKANKGVRVLGDNAGVIPGDYVTVNGISSCFKSPEGNVIRRVLASQIDRLPEARHDYAMKFNGANRVTIPDTPALNPDHMTVECWVKFDRLAYGAGYKGTDSQFPVCKGSARDGYCLMQAGNSPGDYWLAWSWGGIGTSCALVTNRWYHYCGTYDGHTLRQYLDGNLLSEIVPGSISLVGNGQPLYFSFHDINGFNYYLTGEMDEIRLWNYARSAVEIRSTMNQHLNGKESGLVGYWDFNEEMNNQTVFDRTKNRSNGYLGGTAIPDIEDPVRVTSTVGIVEVARTVTTSITLKETNSLISLPCIPLIPDPESVFDGFNIYGNLVSWDPAYQAYNIYDYTMPETFGGMLLGEGYWLSGLVGQQISYKSLPSGIPADGIMADTWISLPGKNDGVNAGGSHLVGCPYNGNVPIGNIQFTDGIDVLSWPQAKMAGWVGSSMSYWTGSDYRSIKSDGTSSVTELHSGVGYWLESYLDNISMIVTAPPPAYTLSSYVNLGDYSGPLEGMPVTIDLITEDGNTILRTENTTLDAEGKFHMNSVAPGTYKVGIKPSHWLRRVTGPVTVSDVDVNFTIH